MFIPQNKVGRLLVNSLKSVSSRILRQEFLPELEKTSHADPNGYRREASRCLAKFNITSTLATFPTQADKSLTFDN